MEFGILGLIILILDVIAILKVVGSGAPTGTKIVWVLVIFMLPLLGLILWYLMGPKGSA